MARLSEFSLVLLVLLQLFSCNYAFSSPATGKVVTRTAVQPLFNTNEDEASEAESPSATSESLEQKMKSWEASEEEIKAATLGGVVPGRSDAFDVGLYIAFPLMVLSGLFFAFFPVIMGNIDTSSVGAPPTS
jgi:hypothetical protein